MFLKIVYGIGFSMLATTLASEQTKAQAPIKAWALNYIGNKKTTSYGVAGT